MQPSDLHPGCMTSCATLGIDEAVAIIEDLQNNNWIDLYTREVNIYFTTFNPAARPPRFYSVADPYAKGEVAMANIWSGRSGYFENNPLKNLLKLILLSWSG